MEELEEVVGHELPSLKLKPTAAKKFPKCFLGAFSTMASFGVAVTISDKGGIAVNSNKPLFESTCTEKSFLEKYLWMLGVIL